MSAPERDRDGVLHDSEATLRQVEEVLEGLGGESSLEQFDRQITEIEDAPTGLQDLVSILVSTYGEIMRTIDSLRSSRGLLEQAAVDRLQRTNAKIAEVSSATEVAATDMLDGLDRALVLIDRLEEDEKGASEERADRDALRNELRDELHLLMNLLQFQDITSQQLGYASGVLADIENRMVRLAKVFDVRGFSGAPGADFEEASAAPVRAQLEAQDSAHCDPEASTLNAGGRQAVADAIFTGPSEG